ncbi:MAG: ubiquinol-cytochrome c reductase iron-sulfur subunit, partial [Gammaproteobacteria bacterium]
MTEDSSNRKQGVDKNRRRFLSVATTVMGGVGIGFASVPFFSSFQPSAKAKAQGAPIEMDISKLEPGQRIIGKWQGKPVWIVRRSNAVVTALEGLNDLLRDPDSTQPQQPEYARNIQRSIKQEY